MALKPLKNIPKTIGHTSVSDKKTIEKYPENYWAYIGIGQVTNELESEKLAYDYMLQHATEINDKTAIKKLKKFDRNSPDFPQLDYMMTTRTSLMNKYGIGMTRENISMVALLKELMLFKGYTFTEKINYLRGSLFSLTHLGMSDDIINDNLFESSASFQVPIFIVHGKYDYQVSYALAREWFEKIDAPEKAFFSFENSAHSPNMEEPEKFVQIIREVALKSKKVSNGESY